MPKRLIKKYTPDPKKIRENKHIQIFGSLLLDQNLWHLNRRSYAGAIAVGLFVAFVPLPAQMIIAAALAIIFRVNIVISVATVWVTNPITMTPMFYAAYTVGTWMMGLPADETNFQFTLETVLSSLADSWQPFLLGCLVLGSASALVGYITARLFWRWSILKKWSLRLLERKRLKRKSK